MNSTLRKIYIKNTYRVGDKFRRNYKSQNKLCLKEYKQRFMTNLLKYPIALLRPAYEKTYFHHAVITELDDHRLREAYAHCRSITRKHASTFYMATRFLPYYKQRSIFAIYGLCRYVDHLVDETEDLITRKKISNSQILTRLGGFKEKLIRAYRGNEQEDAILMAFSDTLNRFNISPDLPLLLLEGVASDLKKNRYRTFEELYDYSYKVASVVGLMTATVFGFNDERARRHAVDLGIAMQLTNILRDVGEDLKKNRIYLPKEELERFQVEEEDLFGHKISEPFTRFMKFQIGRARHYYDRAEQGITMLEKDSRLPVKLAKENYSRILDKIEDNGFDVFGNRAYLNTTEKLAILPRTLLEIYRNS